jgi:hypothetical protein
VLDALEDGGEDLLPSGGRRHSDLATTQQGQAEVKRKRNQSEKEAKRMQAGSKKKSI